MHRALRSPFLTFLFLVLGRYTAITAQEQASRLPSLPADIPKSAVIRMLLTDNTAFGQDAIWKSADGTIHEFFQFNDRGRGPKIYSSYRVDGNGFFASEESTGVDYMKNPVTERFALTSGRAVGQNQAEHEDAPNSAGKFYIDLNGGRRAGRFSLVRFSSPAIVPAFPFYRRAGRRYASCNPYGWRGGGGSGRRNCTR